MGYMILVISIIGAVIGLVATLLIEINKSVINNQKAPSKSIEKNDEEMALIKAEDYQKKGAWDRAEKIYLTAKDKFEKRENTVGKANALLGLGDIENMKGDFEKAHQYYQVAYKLFSEKQSQLGQANVLFSMGRLETKKGLYEQARTCFDQAIALYEQGHHNLGKANAHHGLAYLQTKIGDLDQAKTHLDQANKLYHERNHKLGEANVLYGKGLIAEKNQDSQSKNLIKQAKKIYEIEGILIEEISTR